MSSQFAINAGTSRQSGIGLPVYRDEKHIFTNFSKGFNSSNGLWEIPFNDRLPTFQVHIEADTLVSFSLVRTENGKPLSGSSIGMPLGAIKLSRAFKKDGVQKYCWETSDSFTITPFIPSGRYVGQLLFLNGAEGVELYTEEFVIKDCC
ncbi:hypothetical protein AB832_07970 [Flavobacteriaceae bacterium (ex Bugula neritina AB1)]|nr:hypothetical protein AB832_07970 [Flavobacteriaceae bacterium (ex Bugula neritina AB1)]